MIDNNPSAEGGSVEPQLDEHGNNYKERRLSDGRSFVILKNYFEADELSAILGPAVYGQIVDSRPILLVGGFGVRPGRFRIIR